MNLRRLTMTQQCMKNRLFLVMFVALLACGCGVSYVTPGAGVKLEAIDDLGIKERFETKAAASFPARIAVVRVQQAGYSSYQNQSYGHGAFSVVGTRDVEKQEQFEKLAALPKVAGLATLNRLLLPENLQGVKDLRNAAASLHADMLLIYTLDTSFKVNDQDIGPLGPITLGFAPNQKAYITTTASSVLYDVRTGHVYGVAEASHSTQHQASAWSKDSVVDEARVETEKEAFSKLVDQLCQTWPALVNEYNSASAVQLNTDDSRTLN